MKSVDARLSHELHRLDYATIYQECIPSNYYRATCSNFFNIRWLIHIFSLNVKNWWSKLLCVSCYWQSCSKISMTNCYGKCFESYTRKRWTKIDVKVIVSLRGLSRRVSDLCGGVRPGWYDGVRSHLCQHRGVLQGHHLDLYRCLPHTITATLNVRMSPFSGHYWNY